MPNGGDPLASFKAEQGSATRSRVDPSAPEPRWPPDTNPYRVAVPRTPRTVRRLRRTCVARTTPHTCPLPITCLGNPPWPSKSALPIRPTRPPISLGTGTHYCIRLPSYPPFGGQNGRPLSPFFVGSEGSESRENSGVKKGGYQQCRVPSPPSGCILPPPSRPKLYSRRQVPQHMIAPSRQWRTRDPSPFSCKWTFATPQCL